MNQFQQPFYVYRLAQVYPRGSLQEQQRQMAADSTLVHAYCREVESRLVISFANIQGNDRIYVLSYVVYPPNQVCHRWSQDEVRLLHLP